MKPIIIALDCSENEAVSLVIELQARVWGFKVGSVLFTTAGPSIVRRILALCPNVFLDLKYNDIPTTVEKSITMAIRLDISMLSVHINGGLLMLRAAARAVRIWPEASSIKRPLLLGVTLLTSLDEIDLHELGFHGHPKGISGQVAQMALLAKGAGFDGVIASPMDIASIKNACGNQFKVVTPGIRTKGADHHDQRRILTPLEALQAGADYLVVGREITEASDPSKALDRILLASNLSYLKELDGLEVKI